MLKLLGHLLQTNPHLEHPGGSTGQYINAAREFLLKAQTELDTVENEITDS